MNTVYDDWTTCLEVFFYSEIRDLHNQLPLFVASQDLSGCLAATQKKLSALLSLSQELLADLPAAYMEVYEFLSIAKVRIIKNKFQMYCNYCKALKYGTMEDGEPYRRKAFELANLLGDKFIHEYDVKLNDILYGS